MLTVVLRKLAQMLLTLVGAAALVFVLVRLTGDPARIMLPPGVPESSVEAFRAANGLDQPLIVQFVVYLGRIFTGNFGDSIRYQQPVMELLATRLPMTAQLAVTGLLASCILGVTLGTLAAMKQGTWVDRTVRGVALFGQSTPSFYLGLVLVLVFGVQLRVLPTGGTGSWKNLVLPAIVMCLALLPPMLRLTRGAVLDVRGQDFVRMARSKSLPASTILFRHILRNAMRAPLTVLGLQIGAVISGAVVVEMVFAWPGIGQLLVSGIQTRDFPVVQGIVVLTVVVYLVGSLLIDIAYAMLDPKVRTR